MNATFDLPLEHAHALRILLRRLPPGEILWVLTGSGGLRLQGVDVPVRDLDVQGDEPGVYAIAHRMAECVQAPVYFRESAQMRSHYGALEIDGIKVELMGDVQHRLSDSAWQPAPDLPSLRRWVAWGDHAVPVLDLAYEADAYARMGRAAQAAAIRAVLASRGA
jgi:hypothetical protein